VITAPAALSQALAEQGGSARLVNCNLLLLESKLLFNKKFFVQEGLERTF
jgi:hypothetical protein